MAEWETAYVLTFLGGAFLIAYIGSKLRMDQENAAEWLRLSTWGLQIMFFLFALGMAMIPMGHLDVILGENSITNASLVTTGVTSGVILYSKLWVTFLVILVLLTVLLLYGLIFRQVKQRRDPERDYKEQP